MRLGRLVLLAILSIVVILIGACRTRPPEGDVSPRLEELFGDLHDRGLFDGAAVVGTGDHIIWEKGFGSANVERAVPFTPDTPTDGASLAKTFTAALLIQLEREGVLDLDDPARRFLPELPWPDVTLRHLLTHAGGIAIDYEWFDPFLAPDEIRTTERLLEIVAREKPALAFIPGAAFEYSSFGFDLAALAAARAAGAPFAELLASRIFRPLGMGSAFARPGRLSEFPAVRTLGYRRRAGQLEPHDVFDLEAFHGGSNIVLSARDLHRWNASFMTRPLLDEGGQAEAHRLATIGEGRSGLTLGSWYRSEDGTAFWYSGHLQGFHSEVFRDSRRRRSIVYVSNNTIEPWVQKGIVRAVTAILDGGAPQRLVAPELEDVSSEDYALLAGRWTVGDGEAIEIDSSVGRLTMRRSGVSYRMVPVGPREFYVPGLDFMVGFGRGDSGSFERIHLSSNVAEQWGTRG